MKKGHPCPLQAAFGRLPKGGGGLRPPPPFGSSVKDKDDLCFISFDIFLILFDLFSVSLIICRTLVCARLFWGYLFSVIAPIIGKLSISLFFNDLIVFWGYVKLTSLAWLLMCWAPKHASRCSQQWASSRCEASVCATIACAAAASAKKHDRAQRLRRPQHLEDLLWRDHPEHVLRCGHPPKKTCNI